MMIQRTNSVIGPEGNELRLIDLPEAGTKRWTPLRKAEVVAAVTGGLLSLDEACKRYRLSVDEYLSWQDRVNRHGVPGLRATRTQQYK